MLVRRSVSGLSRASPSSEFTPTVVMVLQLVVPHQPQLANSAADLKPDPGE